MSIKSAAEIFYKTIWHSPDRGRIKEVVTKLKSSTRGYGNKVYPAPILGLLLYDQQKLKRFAGRSAVEELSSWSAEDLTVLFGVHNQIRRFNEQCLKPLTDQLPQAINAVNPYREYPQAVATNECEELLFTRTDAEEVIETFHGHPAFEISISTIDSIRDRPLDYDQTILQLNQEIIEAQPGGEPKWVLNFEEAKRSEHPNVDIFRHVASLICLHNSLANLNQFIYHGLFQDELLEINRNHIIDYSWLPRPPGPSMWLMHIPYGKMFIFEVTDLIIVNIDKPGINGGLGNTLCSIHNQTLPLSMMTPGTLKLRMIDDNLNAYSYLMR
jgi:hypothetical protein